MSFVLMRVISGGQTGVDQVGLEIAKAFGYYTGGMAPKGYRTDAGPNPTLLRDTYGLLECPSSGYRARTIWNVRHADLTVWFGDINSPGGILTHGTAIRELQGKHFLDNPTALDLREALETWRVLTLNVAGNRLRTNPAATELARAVLGLALAR